MKILLILTTTLLLSSCANPIRIDDSDATDVKKLSAISEKSDSARLISINDKILPERRELIEKKYYVKPGKVYVSLKPIKSYVTNGYHFEKTLNNLLTYCFYADQGSNYGISSKYDYKKGAWVIGAYKRALIFVEKAKSC